MTKQLPYPQDDDFENLRYSAVPIVWLLLSEHNFLAGLLFLSTFLQLVEGNEDLAESARLENSTNQFVGINHPGGYVIGHVGNLTIITNQPQFSPTAQPTSDTNEIGANPYRGLQAFGELDSEYFFGRDKEIDELWLRLRNLQGRRKAIRFLPVYGSSGSGKSSLVRAGFIKKLADDPLPSYTNARVVILVPGAHPLESLAIALARIDNEDPLPTDKADELLKRFREGIDKEKYDELRFIADNLQNIDFSPLIILIDQFEEIYSLCNDSHEQECFIENLLTAASDLSRRVLVIATLRDDFLKEIQNHQRLDQLFSQQGYRVPSMDDEALREAIIKPAELSNHHFNVGTVERLIIESRNKRGSLPLLQFALTRIWEALLKGEDPDATLKDIGGVGGALANEAQRIYDGFSLDEDKKIARRVLLKLVQVGDGTPDTRRRVPIRHLIAHNKNPEQVTDIIECFADQSVRLLTYSADNEGAKTVEVSHEALYEHWNELKSWLNENREDLRFYRQLEEATDEWDKTGRPVGSLWQSPKLGRLKSYCKKPEADITATQLSFFQASKRLEIQQKRRQKTILGGLVCGILALSAAAGIAFLNAREASLQQREALIQGTQRTIQSSLSLNTSGQKFDALVMTLRAAKQIKDIGIEDQSIINQTKARFYEALSGFREIRRIYGHTGLITDIALSPKHNILATASSPEGTVRLWKLDGTPIATLQHYTDDSPFDYAIKVGIAPNGTIITSQVNETKLWRLDGSPITTLEGDWVAKEDLLSSGFILTVIDNGNHWFAKLWNLDGTLKTSIKVGGYIDDVNDISVSPNKELIAISSYASTISGYSGTRLWSFDGTFISNLVNNGSNSFGEIYFSPDGSNIISNSSFFSNDRNGNIKLWKYDASFIKEFDNETLASGQVFNPDGKSFITVSINGELGLWTAQLRKLDGDIIARVHHSAEIKSVDFSPDGEMFATASSDGTTKLLKSDGDLVATLRHEHPVWEVYFSPSGTSLMTVDSREDTRIWQLDGSRVHTYTSNTVKYASGAFSSIFDGNHISRDMDIVAVGQGSIASLWQENYIHALDFGDSHGDFIKHIAFSSDGRIIASASLDGTVKLWSRDGTLINTFGSYELDYEKWANHVEFSPDSKYMLTLHWDSAGILRVWKLDGTLIHTFKGVLNGHFSPDSRFIAVEGKEESYLWNLNEGLFKTFDGFKEIIFSSDGKTIATSFHVHNYGTTALWRNDGSHIANLLSDKGVTDVAFSPDGKVIAISNNNNVVKLWNIDGVFDVSLVGHTNSIITVNFSQDGKFIATGSLDETVKLWRRDGALVSTLREGGSEAVRFSADSQTIFTFNRGGHFPANGTTSPAKLWNFDGINIGNIEMPFKDGYFSPDGQALLTLDYFFGSTKIWQSDGTLLADLDAPKTKCGPEAGLHECSTISTVTAHIMPRNAVFSPDNKIIVTSGRGGIINAWLWDFDELVATVCDQIGVSLSHSLDMEDGDRYLCEEDS